MLLTPQIGELFFPCLSWYVKSELDIHGQGFQFIQEHGVHRAGKDVREALTIRSQAAKSRERNRREKSQAKSGSHTIKVNNPIINLPYTDSRQDSGSTTFPLGELIATQSKESFHFGDPELFLASLLRTVKLWGRSADNNISRDEGEAETQLFLFRGRLLRTVQRRLGLPYSQADATPAGIACLILLEVMSPYLLQTKWSGTV